VVIRPSGKDLTLGVNNPVAMRRIVTRDRHGPHISATWIQIWGRHNRVMSNAATRLYYILDGRGWFQVGDEPREEVVSGDAVLIPSGVPYTFEGHMNYFLVNAPAFTEGDDIDVREPGLD
jgi:mannose-6-phosphate isomerase-like protein (cupin superfamily)